MTRLLRFLRGFVAVFLGLLAGTFVLVGGRQLAFGDGFAPSPHDVSASGQAMVVLTWAVAAGLASWVAALISRGRLPSLIASAWMFQMVWLSPGVRPAEVSIRLACAIAVALAGFTALVLHRYRIETQTVRSLPKPAHG